MLAFPSSNEYLDDYATVLPAKSDSDVMFCLQLLSKTLTLHST